MKYAPAIRYITPPRTWIMFAVSVKLPLASIGGRMLGKTIENTPRLIEKMKTATSSLWGVERNSAKKRSGNQTRINRTPAVNTVILPSQMNRSPEEKTARSRSSVPMLIRALETQT